MFELIKATAKDLDLIIDFKYKTIIESDVDNTISDEEKKIIIKYITRNSRKHLDEYKLILVNQDIVGTYMVCKYGDGMLIDEIYLLEAYRGKGIGTNIINDIIKTHNRIYLWVYQSNIRAVNLYKKIGFKIIETTTSRYKMLYQKENNTI